MSLLTNHMELAIKIAASTGEELPQVMKLSFDFIYLGVNIDGLMEVEIKNEYGELGWLYGDHSMIVFGLPLVAIKLEEFRDFVEHELKDKVFSDNPEVNTLVRGKNLKSIYGYVDLAKIPDNIIYTL